jgi:hypothetical protein
MKYRVTLNEHEEGVSVRFAVNSSFEVSVARARAGMLRG